MIFTVHGAAVYAYTGGKSFNPGQPTLVFVHGVLNDHSVWILQTRYLAHHGWNVLAVDLPGHGRSAGAPPTSVEAAADWLIALLDAAGLPAATLIGHSFGSLIAMEAAARAPSRVRQLVLLGTAAPMKVSPALLQASLDEPLVAIDMVNRFSHALLAPPPSVLGPGTWVAGGARALMRRVLASNPAVNVFHTGFKACDDYRGGESAMEKVEASTLFIAGQRDQMTPPQAAQPLVLRARHGRLVTVDAGHDLMAEAPEAVLAALNHFLVR
ncbi:alpha/beta hydrolase [Rhodoferax koreense]|uniref:Alpha/beta hydrolase n=1 Tax=Rhodoferax koreensis TaxID=1842727 RepID=A0A1P8JUG6_9BURK|nr:alpha/beta hydrolase [Rhodoferax koreense]APW37397.1 alpha/beta hydrolase [Rhodoferax koreense]